MILQQSRPHGTNRQRTDRTAVSTRKSNFLRPAKWQPITSISESQRVQVCKNNTPKAMTVSLSGETLQPPSAKRSCITLASFGRSSGVNRNAIQRSLHLGRLGEFGTPRNRRAKSVLYLAIPNYRANNSTKRRIEHDRSNNLHMLL